MQCALKKKNDRNRWKLPTGSSSNQAEIAWEGEEGIKFDVAEVWLTVALFFGPSTSSPTLHCERGNPSVSSRLEADRENRERK